jgi:CRP-like cAMP-binding protein
VAEKEFGPVIREVLPGESFGELALLQHQNLRTATVLAAGQPSTRRTTSPLWLDQARVNPHQAHRTTEASGCVLIKVTRELFDSSVTSLQVAQLEERLQFIMRFQVRS